MKACGKGIEVICALDTSAAMPVRVRGDAERVKQVVLNLLSNAVKFTQSGEVEMRTELESETANHHVIKVSVRDTGIGIPEAALSKLFSRFSQVDNGTTRNYGGTGLGLAISKQLVELMSGRMGVISTPGKGSTFWATFVLEKAEVLPDETRQLPSDMSPMLVISTNFSMRNMRVNCLESWGADVSSAANEKEAQVYLNAHPTVTAMISLSSLPEYNLAAVKPILDFITGSIMQARFWIILCPINVVGKIRDLFAAMAESYAAKGETLAANAALAITILSKPVRQGALYDCLTQIHANGVYQKTTEHGIDNVPLGRLRTSRLSRSQTAIMPDYLLQPVDEEEAHNLTEEVSAAVDGVVANLNKEAPAFNVLVAEDSPANSMAIKRMLTKYCVTVTVVADGSEAVELVVTRGLRYELAIFDLNMPILGGVGALHRIREASIDMPVVALSASVDDEQVQQLTEEGFSMVTTKPLKIDTCRNILETYGHVLPLDPSTRQLAVDTSGNFSSTRISARGEDTQTSVAGSSALVGEVKNMVPLGRGGKTQDPHLILVVEDNGGVDPPRALYYIPALHPAYTLDPQP